MARYIPLLPLILFITTSCGSEPTNHQPGEQFTEAGGLMSNDPYGQLQEGNNTLADGSTRAGQGGGDEIKMHPVMDARTGMVSREIPLPASWTMNSAAKGGEPAITGPGGVKVYYQSGGTYTYPNDPYMQQTMQMAGMAVRPPMEISAYVQQDVAQYFGQKGLRLVKQYPLPQIAAGNEAYSAKLFKSAPSQEYHSVMGTDWQNAKGEPVFMIVNMSVSQAQNDVFWSTSLEILEAEPTSIEKAKAALINGIVNTRYDPQQIAAHNAMEQQKNNQSWSQHNATMQQNQRHFDQRQQTHRETQEHINKSNMDAYNYRQEVNDGIQHNFNNYIQDEKTVRDANTGEQYQVGSGADQYWMNSNQEYIPSNDANYDPNLDPNVKDQQWQEVEIVP